MIPAAVAVAGNKFRRSGSTDLIDEMVSPIPPVTNKPNSGTVISAKT